MRISDWSSDVCSSDLSALFLKKACDSAALVFGDQALEHCPETRHRALARPSVGIRNARPELFVKLALQRLARRAKPKQTLASVARAHSRLDQSAFLQVVQHPAQRLLGDGQQAQQDRKSSCWERGGQ